MESERYRKRHQFLVSPEFKRAVDAVAPVLNEFSPFCLIGGLAVAHYINPPHTLDIDLLVVGYWKRLYEFCKLKFRPHGWRVTMFGFPRRSAGSGIPEKGVRLYREEPEKTTFDLILSGNDAFLNQVVGRAEYVRLQTDVELKVATVEDIIVIKTLAGREKDSEDIAQIYKTLGDKINQAYVDEKLEELDW